jgi:hypothetical protein
MKALQIHPVIIAQVEENVDPANENQGRTKRHQLIFAILFIHNCNRNH